MRHVGILKRRFGVYSSWKSRRNAHLYGEHELRMRVELSRLYAHVRVNVPLEGSVMNYVSKVVKFGFV